jgi:hypothetical protein
MLMSNGQKSCLGFLFLFAALALSVLTLLAGGFNAVVQWFSGEVPGLNSRIVIILAVGIFVFFFAISIYWFLKVRDYSWFPAILAGIYTIVPDLIFGPEDDILVLILGGVISGLLAYRKEKQDAGIDKSQYKKLQ